MERLRCRCVPRSLGTATLLCLLVHYPGFAQVTVAVVPGSAMAGGPAALNISVTTTSGSNPAALEWTLAYSGNDLTDMSLQAGPAATSASKSLSCTSGVGSVKCIAWGINTNTIPNGTIATASFNVSSNAPSSSALQITESLGASAQGSGIASTGSGAILTIVPANRLKTLACSLATVVTPATVTCTATLVAKASTTTTLSLGFVAASANVTMPASVTVPVGAISATFTVAVGAATTPTTLIVTASLNDSSASFSLSLKPAAAINALTCTPATVFSLGTATCTITLSQPAPVFGADVALKLGTPVAAITMPTSITLAAGATSASFSIKISAVAAKTTTSVIASLNGTSKSFTLTLALPFGGT